MLFSFSASYELEPQDAVSTRAVDGSKSRLLFCPVLRFLEASRMGHSCPCYKCPQGLLLPLALENSFISGFYTHSKSRITEPGREVPVFLCRWPSSTAVSSVTVEHTAAVKQLGWLGEPSSELRPNNMSFISPTCFAVSS